MSATRELLTAARATFTEEGLDAPLDDIATRAGVGHATLYRRFPTRDDLITAVFIEGTAENIAHAEQALQNDDPWAGLTNTSARRAASRPPTRTLSPSLTQASGTLRADFTPEDVVLLLLATAGILRRTGPTALERD